MKKIDLAAAAAIVAVRPAQAVLLLVMAVALVALVIPFTIQPLIQRLLAPTAASEPWPAAPPAYVAPLVAPARPANLRPTATPLPAPVWQELSYLTSVEFTTTSVVQEERTADLPWIGTIVSDRLLLKAVGEVQVGIDLAQVQQVQIEGRTIRFIAPKPVVTSVELLPEESQVFERVNVWLVSQYAGLETTALERARQQMRSEIANNASMMKLAQEFARLQLVAFLQKAGFTTVEITFE
ncbi:MAG: DUF4230 domain-containing protein [Caldilineaceae bacterium]|nr:DUF4230 domain-containing protein [Caldilineaceae bacterium]